MKVSHEHKRKFQKTILDFYRKNRRDFPWRPPALTLRKSGTLDPYRVLVSEVMLQQTQANRVVPFFVSFIEKFPSVRALAGALRSETLRAWQGLGYNRRALNLKRAAEMVVLNYRGSIPRDAVSLCSLPGVGPYTARAVMAFAWDLPTVFIETNIRTVYLHFFFKNRKNVSDSELLSLISETFPTNKVHPSSRSSGELCSSREWYYALMDYGSFLKKTVGNPNTRSKHYTVQGAFQGSRREVRGAILRQALAKGVISASDISLPNGVTGTPVAEILRELETEGFLREIAGKFRVA